MIIHRYIISQCFAGILVVLFIIGLLELFITAVEEINNQLKGDYDTAAALKFVITTSPQRLYQFTPFILLIGSLVGLGALANHSELTVLRAAGLSPGQILLPVFALILILLGLFFSIGEGLLPKVSQQSLLTKQQLQGEIDQQEGFWFKQDEDFVFIGRFDGEKLESVTVFDWHRDLLQGYQFFEQLVYDSSSQQWQNIPESHSIGWQFNTPNWLQLPEQSASILQFSASSLLSNNQRGNQLNIFELYQLIQQLSLQELNYLHYEILFYNKLLMPLLTLILIWLASSMIFGSNRSQSTGQRIFIGVLLAVMMVIIQNAITPFIYVYQLSGIFVGITPIIIAMILALALHWRAR